MAEKGCAFCDHYSALVDPRERSDGAVIYGYCFKSGDKDYSPNMGKGLPVFIDGSGATCKNFKRHKKKESSISALRQQEQKSSEWICTLKCTALMEEGMCSHGGLCCLYESQRTIKESEPLTLDELRMMDAPVWLRCYQVDGDGYWCLCKNGIIITPAGNSYDVSEIPHWAFYRQKLEEGGR